MCNYSNFASTLKFWVRRLVLQVEYFIFFSQTSRYINFISEYFGAFLRTFLWLYSLNLFGYLHCQLHYKFGDWDRGSIWLVTLAIVDQNKSNNAWTWHQTWPCNKKMACFITFEKMFWLIWSITAIYSLRTINLVSHFFFFSLNLY